MPIPMAVARFNRRVTNPFTRRFAGRAPGFAIVVHRGRSSGRVYRTPVNAFKRRGGYVLALTYGPRADWVRNVLAAGECLLVTRGRRLRMTNPRLVHDPTRRQMPLPVRLILGLLGVEDFLLLDRAPPAAR
ncbi:MAG TPA: nitroreductase family deazaflavin-dependent oxidoreductase [Chloroflexota bacterium]|nr:nitroreductase family deazaflavin-dependent oxidoreductase [Chloroflexota bacterium]